VRWRVHKAQYEKHEEFKDFLDRTSVGAPSIRCRQRYPDWYAAVVHFTLCHMLCYYYAVRGDSSINAEFVGTLRDEKNYLGKLPNCVNDPYKRIQNMARQTLYSNSSIVIHEQDAEWAFQIYPSLKTFFLTPAV
jgi:hypothetical protein